MSTPEIARTVSEAKGTFDIKDLSVCFHCETKGLTETDKFCPNCGFPQRGTQEEMKKFKQAIGSKRIIIESHAAAIKKATNILFVLSGLFAVLGFILGAVNDFDGFTIVTNLIIAGIYLGLAFWSKKSAFPAILTGFIIYIVIIALNAVVDPITIVQGIIWKAIIISAFYYGYKGAKEAEELQKELDIMNSSSKDLSAKDAV